MRVFSLVFCGLIFGCLAMAGCSQTGASSTMLPADRNAVSQQRTSSSFTILYSFKGGVDGAIPTAGLAALNGKLYGTTSRGGSPHSGLPRGTIFRINTGGLERVIHRFNRVGVKNGADPQAQLTALDDALYGTTSSGGSQGLGTAFEMTTAGKERVLHSFGSYDKDGVNPTGGLLPLNGAFYGVTTFGGAANEGTVFTLSASGTERVLYSFKGGSDGDYPSGLAVLGGKLYGTTQQGGDANCQCGVVFALSAAGKERVLYRFTGGQDGANPYAGPTEFNGALYGTTNGGGNPNCSYGGGCGTVFKVTASGTESILYAFDSSKRADGIFPQTALTVAGGRLYGTTRSCNQWGYGTIFEVDASGKERVLYTFTGGSDGAHPSSLTLLNGLFYGTTPIGGANNYGTVFALSP